MKSVVRGAMVVVAICSWFAISNHCAFAALATKTDSVQTGCPFHSKPKEKPSTGAQCCKVLRAIASVATKSWARDDATFSNTNLGTEELVLIVPLRERLTPSSLDTGPPGKTSFAELIGSLLAHAPPSLA